MTSSSVPNAGQDLKPDSKTTRTFFTGLHPGVYELRIPRTEARRPGVYGTQAMYIALPDDLDHSVQLLARVTGRQAGGIYTTISPTNPALLGRGRGAFFLAKATATDADVERRYMFYVDVDAERPTGINANATEIAAAMARTHEAADWLKREGLGKPAWFGTSGSGGMLLYRVDYPNDGPTARMLAGVLEALAAQFPADGAKIDTSVYNAARLVRLPGSINGKSVTPQPDRPWTLVRGEWTEAQS